MPLQVNGCATEALNRILHVPCKCEEEVTKAQAKGSSRTLLPECPCDIKHRDWKGHCAVCGGLILNGEKG